MNRRYDCVVIGGGPGGLTAALYLARFRRELLVIDAKESRAALIPVSHNFPAFPHGVTGPALIARLHQQLAPYEIGMLQDTVVALERDDEGYALRTERGQSVQAQTVILATGISDLGMTGVNWRIGIDTGGLRLCPVCDAYEVIDKDVAVISRTEHGAAHAMHLRDYTGRLTLYHAGDEANFSAEDAAILSAANIPIIHAGDAAVEVDSEGRPAVRSSNGIRSFDAVYPMFGCHPRNSLAKSLGAECDVEGKLVTDIYQQTSLPGLFAVGDVVSGLNQISVAVGQAAIAATHIHQTLRKTAHQTAAT